MSKKPQYDPEGIRFPDQKIEISPLVPEMESSQESTDPETGETVQTNLVGVYTLVGGRAEFKPVEILTEESDFYVVSPATEGRAVLRAGDEVIVRATELYDGQLLEY